MPADFPRDITALLHAWNLTGDRDLLEQYLWKSILEFRAEVE